MNLRDRVRSAVVRPAALPWRWGLVVAAVLISAEMLVVHLLTRLAPDSAFGAIFLFGVLVVSAGWGFGTAIATSVASAIAYAYVHVLDDGSTLLPAVVVFSVLALLTNLLVGQSRLRAVESDQRRREADLLAELARTVLRADLDRVTLDEAGRRLSELLDLPQPGAVFGGPDAVPTADQHRIALHDGADDVGSLLVPRDLPAGDARRVHRVVPALEALLAAAREREALHEQTVDLARQQMALRRVATLVASRAEPDEVHRAVVAELTEALLTEHVSLVRFEDDSTYEVLAVQDSSRAEERLLAGERLPVGGHNVCTLVLQTGEPVAIDYTEATGPVAERLRPRGFRTGLGVPITVDGRTWGALALGVGDAEIGPDICERLADFADLVATSVDNRETRAQLTRSRARVVAAGDQARRTIERDLHDGAQQRIVSLGLELRATQAAVPGELTELRSRLDRSVDVLSQIHSDLQELSRGIHPAVLSRGGLAAALKTLARRSPVPVSLTIDIPERLPDEVEVAAYYAVAEALTNTAKYAEASEVTIHAADAAGTLEVVVADDGVGGAHVGGGSGLIGLHDRIDAAGGTLTITSAAGAGTSLTILVPHGSRP